jgi:hypothetical protein
MMIMARYSRPTVPAHWHVAEVARVRGKVLTPGRVVRIKGERGAFAFLRHVTNTRTGAEWLDVRDTTTGALRAFHADRVRTVTRGTVPATPVAGRTVTREAVAA